MLSIARDVLLWLIGVELLSLAALPLSIRLFRGLPGLAFAQAKILGLILVAYIAWVTAIFGATAFTGATLVVLTAALAAVGWWLWGRDAREEWASSRTLAIGVEATFAVVFLVAVAVRAFNAPIEGQEKQMDFTFLHSLIQARALPAPDLWLAGFGMPYYYFGYLVQALPAKVLPIDPAVAYNLAMATVLALSATGAFGVAAALVKLGGGFNRSALGFGALGAFTLVIMGNLEAMFEWIASMGVGDAATWAAIGIKNLTANTGGFPPSDGGWWFRAARVIPNIQPDGIDEFPYFSFLLGDLHPHYMAIPLAILIGALACTQLVQNRSLRSDWLRFGVCAIVLGAVIPSNTWDVPVFWGIFGLATLVPALRSETMQADLVDRAKDLGLVAAVAVACYVPYFVGYVSQPLGIGFTQQGTMFGSLFVLFGPLLVLTLMGGVVGLASRARSDDEPAAIHLPALAAGSLVGIMLTILHQPTLGFLAAALIFWIVLTWIRVRETDSIEAVATGILAIAGLGSILIPEVVYLKDVFATRMNTVFKFYYDAWILLALVSPLIAWEMVVLARSRAVVQPTLRALAGVSVAVSVLLILGGAIYPVAATATKSRGAIGAPTLDGMVHLRLFRADDAAAIQWLRQSYPTAGTVEAVGDDYSDAGRFSTFGGVPTLVGWTGHEVQWRGPNPTVDQRRELARRVYTAADPAAVKNDLEAAHMQFIVVGSLEREIYGPNAGSNLARTFPVVKQFGQAVVYGVGGQTG